MQDGRDEEFSTGEDSAGDGFDNYDEELTDHDPKNPDDTASREEVGSAPAEEDAVERL